MKLYEFWPSRFWCSSGNIPDFNCARLRKFSEVGRTPLHHFRPWLPSVASVLFLATKH